MKKITLLILSVICACCFVLGLTACNKPNSPTGNNSGNTQSNITNSENSANQGQTPDSSNQGHLPDSSSSDGGSENPPVQKHEHSYGEWLFDETNHWKECTANGDCDAKTTDLGKHTLNSETNICTVCGQTIIEGQLAFSEIKDGENVIAYSVTGLVPESEKATFITIPSEYNGKPITEIGEGAFENCTSLIKVVIPNSITSIGHSAFYACTGLTSITIPESVTFIEEQAFFVCSGLTSINVSKNNKVYHSQNNCLIETASKTLILGCVNSIIPDDGSVTVIGSQSFIGCTNLTNITIPDSITFIDLQAFSLCINLTSINVSKNNKVYHSQNNCLIETASKTLILGCSNSIIPDDGSVTNIGFSAFAGCTLLTNIVIPDSVTTISEWAFYLCSNLTSITIGSGLTSINDGAFYGCIKIKNVYYKNTEENWSALTINEGNENLTDATVYYYTETEPNKDGNYWHYNKDGSIETVTYIPPKPTEGLQFTKISDKEEYEVTGIGTATETDIVIPSTYQSLPVTNIGSYAFDRCTSLTSLVIPDSVTSISNGAFRNCNNLTKITIPFVGATKDGTKNTHFGYIFGAPSSYYNDIYLPTSLKTVVITGGATINSEAFEQCDYLTSIIIPDSVTTIEYRAFDSCDRLSSITIPNSVTTIEFAAFRGCRSLTSITIPNGVTTIYCGTFYNCENLSNIKMSSNVTKISVPSPFFGSVGYEGAFGFCKSLTSITIPDSVTSIDSSAFEYCTGLTNITIPDSVTSIGNEVFNGCTGLTNITIPDSVTSIGNEVFNGCTGLTSLVIPDSVTSIGNGAFIGCTGLTSITIPDSITSINGSLFNGCVGLTNITIPTSIISIGNYAFENCIGLISVTIPDSVSSIGNNAFDGCEKLVEVYNLSSLNITKSDYNNGRIGYYALDVYTSKDSPSKLSTKDGYIFYENGEEVYLVGYVGTETNLVLPDKFNNKNYGIYQYAFYNKNLTSVTIPNSVTTIEFAAFLGCTGLTSVTIPDSVTSIGNKVFNGCTGLTNITIGNSVTSIGAYAFRGCTNLTSIIIPNSVASIGNYAFENCIGLRSVTIGCGVTSIEDNAFDGCYKLVEVYNLSSLNITKSDYNNGRIGYYALDVYTSKDSPSKLSTKDGYIFYENGEEVYLVGYVGTETNLVLPDKFNNKNYGIHQYAFYNKNLTNITIPDSVTSIGGSAFGGCTGLTNITIPDSVTSIGGFAFSDCTGLTSVTIPNSVTTIEFAAFCGCIGLRSVTIPNSVTSIGESAFSDCTGLTSIIIPNSVASIGESAFSDCTGLTSIIIPNSVASIGKSAFRGCILRSVYYQGTTEEWLGKIPLNSSNSNLINATVYFYSETEPALNADGTAYDGNYWHYVDGVATPWFKQQN